MVIDASVLLKCFLYEEDSAAALSIINQHRDGIKTIKSPALILYELTNALAFKNRFPLEDVAEALELIFTLPLEVYSLDKKDFLLAAQLSKKNNISVYDAAYLAVAINLDCPLVTADKKLYQNTRTLENVILLSDFTVQENL